MTNIKKNDTPLITFGIPQGENNIACLRHNGQIKESRKSQ